MRLLRLFILIFVFGLLVAENLDLFDLILVDVMALLDLQIDHVVVVSQSLLFIVLVLFSFNFQD